MQWALSIEAQAGVKGKPLMDDFLRTTKLPDMYPLLYQFISGHGMDGQLGSHQDIFVEPEQIHSHPRLSFVMGQSITL